MLVFDDRLAIHSGDRVIELLLVASGDLVPSPYAFNVLSRLWAAALGLLGFPAVIKADQTR